MVQGKMVSRRLDPMREQVGDKLDRIKPAEGTHKPKKAKREK